jgi:hypothetical protein
MAPNMANIFFLVRIHFFWHALKHQSSKQAGSFVDHFLNLEIARCHRSSLFLAAGLVARFPEREMHSLFLGTRGNKRTALPFSDFFSRTL